MYLVYAPTRRGKPAPGRVLYWFRTPPGVKVGRQPFDEATQRALESQYPNLMFDWKKIASTPMPPPVVVEPWRERRRAERSARQERAIAVEDVSDAVTTAVITDVSGSDVQASVIQDQNEQTPEDHSSVVLQTAAPEPASSPVPSSLDPGRRRRRRGGRRRNRPAASPETVSQISQPPASEPSDVAAADEADGSTLTHEED